MIRIGVVIVESGVAGAPPDPLFLTQGGPGGSGVELFAEAVASGRFLQRVTRDIVIVEQRGTLFADPALLCTEESTELLDETLELTLSYEEELARSLAAYGDCVERLRAEGVDLDDFDTLENAADIELLRQALGYERINFYGVSYGTLLGLQLMRTFPEHLRSVVLDGVVVPQSPFVEETMLTADRAFDLLFASCTADSACAAAYPDLERRFYALVDALNADPTRITLRDLYTGERYTVPFDGDDLIDAFFLLFYDTSLLPALPLVIANAEVGRFGVIEQNLSLQIFDRTFAVGMYYAVLCAEVGEVSVEVTDRPDVVDPLERIQERDLLAFTSFCELWDVEALPDFVREPVISDVPTLLLSGAFDPITPPDNAERVAQRLTNSFVYTAPFTGHGTIFDDTCALAVMEEFIQDPRVTPDPACLSLADEDPQFILPGEVVETDLNQWLSYLLFALSEPSFTTAGLFRGPLLFIAALLLLLSITLVWPLVWLFGRLDETQEEGEEKGRWLRLAGGLLGVATALLALVFTVGLFAVVVMAAIDDPLLLTFGLPPASRLLFLLAPLILLLTGGMATVTLLAWLQSAWGGLRRSYYTAVVLAALIIAGVMVNMGFVTALVR